MSMMGSSLKASLFKKSCGGHWPHDSQGHQRGCGQRPGRSLGRVNGVDTNAAFMGKKMDIYQNHPKNGIPKSDGAKSEKSLYFFCRTQMDLELMKRGSGYGSEMGYQSTH